MRLEEFKSPTDGSTVAIQFVRRWKSETEFEVHVKTPSFSGCCRASTYLSGSPSRMFREMAAEWRGWKGTKDWSDLESRVKLAGSADSTGHITLTVELVGSDSESHLRVALRFDAGQLDEMAASVSELLG